MTLKTAPAIQRRHDLDALRAFAMLLGIAFHTALPFASNSWMVSDTKKSAVFVWFTLAVHGFRMSLFILVSGYFSMMIFRRRGLIALIKQRFARVFVPFILAAITLVPLERGIMTWANPPAPVQSATTKNNTIDELAPYIRKHDVATLTQKLEVGVDANQADAEMGIPSLSWAAMSGDVAAINLLLKHGANPNPADRSGRGPLHGAVFMGEPECVGLLLSAGTNPLGKGNEGDSVVEGARADFGTTRFIAGVVLHLQVKNENDLKTGREKCLNVLSPFVTLKADPKAAEPVKKWSLQWMRDEYREFIFSPKWIVKWSNTHEPVHLILTPLFDHLWFLWYLCWLVAMFCIAVKLAGLLGITRLPHWLVMSPFRLLWLIPLTMLPQLFMGLLGPNFGPDTSVGIIPEPHILLYYFVFFLFGAAYYDCDDNVGKVGRIWWLSLPLALAVALPLGVPRLGDIIGGGLLQVLFAWCMCFGLMGLFRQFLSAGNSTIRYLADSAYWLYLAHHPLVILMITWERTWNFPAIAKFCFVSSTITIVLLVSYQLLVRHTWLGRLLNGPSTSKKPAEQLAKVQSELTLTPS